MCGTRARDGSSSPSGILRTSQPRSISSPPQCRDDGCLVPANATTGFPTTTHPIRISQAHRETEMRALATSRTHDTATGVRVGRRPRDHPNGRRVFSRAVSRASRRVRRAICPMASCAIASSRLKTARSTSGQSGIKHQAAIDSAELTTRSRSAHSGSELVETRRSCLAKILTGGRFTRDAPSGDVRLAAIG